MTEVVERMVFLVSVASYDSSGICAVYGTREDADKAVAAYNADVPEGDDRCAEVIPMPVSSWKGSLEPLWIAWLGRIENRLEVSRYHDLFEPDPREGLDAVQVFDRGQCRVFVRVATLKEAEKKAADLFARAIYNGA